MTAPAPGKPAPARLRLTPLGGAIAGVYVGAMGAAMVIGMLLGAGQTEGAFGRLSIPLGAFSGPMILLGELGDLFTGRGILSMHVAPWALPAALLCGWIGWRWAGGRAKA